MVLERGFLAQPFGNYWSHSPKVESRIVSYEFKIGKAIVRLTQGDITEMAIDVVVNAANPTLMVAAESTEQFTEKVDQESSRNTKVSAPQNAPQVSQRAKQL